MVTARSSADMAIDRLYHSVSEIPTADMPRVVREQWLETAAHDFGLLASGEQRALLPRAGPNLADALTAVLRAAATMVVSAPGTLRQVKSCATDGQPTNSLLIK